MSVLSACHADANTRPIAWGVFVPTLRGGPPDTTLTGVSAFVGNAPAYVHRFVALSDEVPLAELDAIQSAGATPIVTIEPWDPNGGTEQPRYALRHIADGAYDADFQRWGHLLGGLHRPVLLRFAHEMNGRWYPWSVGVNGNSADDYVKAWQRMWKIVHDAAPNVKFVWAPNSMTEGLADFGPMYPGAAMVDRLGLDGYNWGDGGGHSWLSPAAIFAESVKKLSSLPGSVPILITEVASAEDANNPQRKADWITDFIRQVRDWDDVEGFVWFQANKERDWRFTSSDPAREAFDRALASATRKSPWISDG